MSALPYALAVALAVVVVGLVTRNALEVTACVAQPSAVAATRGAAQAPRAEVPAFTTAATVDVAAPRKRNAFKKTRR